MKKLFTVSIVLAAFGLVGGVCLASGGRVSSPDGSPVVGATVKVIKDGKEKLQLSTDARGRFVLPDKKFKRARVQISAPNGKEYATANLPVAIFQGNELAVVLHKK
jgi:hypothetical protein